MPQILYVVGFLLCALAVCQSHPANSSYNGESFAPASKKYIHKHEKIECGFISQCDQGFLAFRPFQNVPPNIRCSWTLAVEHATSYKLNLIYAGFFAQRHERIYPEEDRTSGLVVTPVRFESNDVTTSAFDDVNVPVYLEAQVVVITFFTKENYKPGTGFILEFSSGTNSTNTIPVTSNSEYQRVQVNNVYRHPTSIITTPDNYDGRELSVISFIPSNNEITRGKELYMSYRKLVQAEDIGCRYFKLEYYALNFLENGEIEFSSKGIVCDDTFQKKMIVSDFAIAVISSRRVISDPKRRFEIKYEEKSIHE